jgi:hypothetical protein
MHFRVFEKLLELYHFLNNSFEANNSFNIEKELNEYLSNLHLN